VKWLEFAGTAWVDDQGQYELVGLEPGSYCIFVPAPEPSYADGWVLLDFAGGRRDRVDAVLAPQKLATLRLKVLEPDGSPAAGLSFWLQCPNGTSRTIFASGGGDGIYAMQVPVGEQVVSASRTGFDAEVTATFKEGETTEREAKLRPVAKNKAK
jgi:hypothetical protein